MGNGIWCRSATCARVSCNTSCQDWYECSGLARLSRATFRARTASSTRVGETMLGWQSTASVATGKALVSVRVCFFSAVLLKLASGSLWTFASCIFSAWVVSSLFSNHRLSIILVFSASFGSLTWRTPFSSNVRCAFCISKSEAVASSTNSSQLPSYPV